jgi:phage shock protein C
METAVRRLTRSRSDRVFAGVCGGLAAYMGLDPVLVRVLYVALTFLSGGTGILLYVLAWIIVPAAGEDMTPLAPKDESSKSDSRRVFGILLVVVGLLALASTALPWFSLFHNLRLAGPIVLIAFGLALLMWRREAIETKSSESTRTRSVEDGSAPHSVPPIADRIEPQRLTRAETGRKIAGVCAGLGEYFNIDSTIVRLLFIAGSFAGGAGIILYLVMWIVVPLRSHTPLTGARA